MVRRRVVAVLACLMASSLSLSACGFTPLYGEASPTQALSDVRVETGDGRIDFLVQEALLDGMNARYADGPYLLRTATSQGVSRLGVGADAIASRYAVTVTIRYEVIDTQSGDRITRGQTSGEASYDAPKEVYAEIAAQRDAEARASRLAADRVILQLARLLTTRGPVDRVENAESQTP